MASRPTKRTGSDGVTPEVNYFYDGKDFHKFLLFSRGAFN